MIIGIGSDLIDITRVAKVIERHGDRFLDRIFTDAERAALALAEAMTRLDDRMDPVPDAVWAEAAKHYDERALGGLVLWIATTNLFNRVNVTTRPVFDAVHETDPSGHTAETGKVI